MAGAETKRPPTDDTARAAKAAAVLGATFTVFALGLYGGRAAFSVLLGSVIAVANLMMMRAIIRSLIQGPEDETPDAPADEGGPKPDHAGAGRRGGFAWGIFAVLKILVLFGGIWILLTRGLVDPMGLVAGYGVLPLGIAVGTLRSSLGTGRGR